MAVIPPRAPEHRPPPWRAARERRRGRGRGSSRLAPGAGPFPALRALAARAAFDHFRHPDLRLPVGLRRVPVDPQRFIAQCRALSSALRISSADLNNPLFWQSAEFTLVFCVVGVFGSWVVGLALAMLLRKRVHARACSRPCSSCPGSSLWSCPSTAWNWLVATPGSPVPRYCQPPRAGLVLPLDEPLQAKVLVCLFKVWLSFPFMMLMASAALAGVDKTSTKRRGWMGPPGGSSCGVSRCRSSHVRRTSAGS